jgi:uncharacterized protein YueI
MDNLKNRIDRATSGEHRLLPDEQRLYLNTFRERVLLAIDFSDAQNRALKSNFDTILTTFDGKYDKVFVKISCQLADDLTSFYLKKALEHHFDGQLLTTCQNDHYGIVIHTDYAVNFEKINLTEIFPDFLHIKETTKKTKKKHFFSKLFG